MTARTVPARRPHRRRIQIVPIQLSPELWLVACGCGHQEKQPDREAARGARRRHQAAHDRAAASEHPVASGRGGGAS